MRETRRETRDARGACVRGVGGKEGWKGRREEECDKPAGLQGVWQAAS